jgi:hypothetical protein
VVCFFKYAFQGITNACFSLCSCYANECQFFRWIVVNGGGKKGKCLLKDLMNDLVPYMNDPESMSLILPGYFSGTGAEKIELLGVIRKRGCNVANIPKMGKVQVAVNGVPVKNKASVNGGTITFIIEQGDGMGGIMTISMRLL